MELIRGDTFAFKFQRKGIDDKPIMEKAKNVWFTVKESYYTEEKIMQKTLKDGNITFTDDGYYHVVIEHNDTKDLNYGIYFCDIQIENNNDIRTIYVDKLILQGEVTFEGSEN